MQGFPSDECSCGNDSKEVLRRFVCSCTIWEIGGVFSPFQSFYAPRGDSTWCNSHKFYSGCIWEFHYIFVVVWLLPAWQGFKETDSQEDCSWWCMLVIGKLVHLFLVKDFLLRGQSSRSCRTSHLAGLLGDDGLSEALCGFSLAKCPHFGHPNCVDWSKLWGFKSLVGTFADLGRWSGFSCSRGTSFTCCRRWLHGNDKP